MFLTSQTLSVRYFSAFCNYLQLDKESVTHSTILAQELEILV